MFWACDDLVLLCAFLVFVILGPGILDLVNNLNRKWGYVLPFQLARWGNSNKKVVIPPGYTQKPKIRPE